MSAAAPKILVIGDTPRWISSVKETLPPAAETNFRTDCAGVNEILYFEDRKCDLLILALCLGGKDDGLKILRELLKLRDAARSDETRICVEVLLFDLFLSRGFLLLLL